MNWLQFDSKTLWLAVATLAVSTACSGKIFEIARGEEAARGHRDERVLAFMTVEEMFPDERVRALASAAGGGDIEEIDRLVATGIDVSSRGTGNATPLFWSMQNSSGFIRLLELGADPNVVFRDGGSVVHWAVRARDPVFLQAALAHGGDPNLVAGFDDTTPTFSAMDGHPDAVGLLLDAGADINARSNSGNTAAMVAARMGRFDFTYTLLSLGASHSEANAQGMTLVDIVRKMQGAMDPNHEQARWQRRVVEWFAARGIDVSD